MDSLWAPTWAVNLETQREEHLADHSAGSSVMLSDSQKARLRERQMELHWAHQMESQTVHKTAPLMVHSKAET